MKTKFSIYFSIVAVAGIIFYIGSSGLKNSQVDNSDLLLANNSLISRFAGDAPEKIVKPKGVVKLSNETGIFPVFSKSDSQLLYYSPKDGQIRFFDLTDRVLTDLSSSKIAYKLKPGLSDIIWSSDQKEIIAHDGNKFVYFNLETGKQKNLPQNISRILFSANNNRPDGANTVFMTGLDENQDFRVYIANLDNGFEKEIFKTRLDDWQISWPKPDTVSLANNSSLFLLDIQTGSLERIFNNTRSLKINWSPDGSKLIYSSENELYYFNLANRESVDLNLAINPSQCVWNTGDNAVFCYNSKSFIVIDVNQENPQIKTLSTNPFGLNVADILVNEIGDYLIFRETILNKFYGLYLNQ